MLRTPASYDTGSEYYIVNTIILLLLPYSEAEIAEMDLAAVAAEIDLEADQKEEESS